jgi:hypothetical protein
LRLQQLRETLAAIERQHGLRLELIDITNHITAGLTRIERARGFLEAATLSDAWVREVGRYTFILEG